MIRISRKLQKLSKPREVKDLCIKIVRHLDKLSQGGDSECNNYCNYIRYCLCEQISEILTNKSAKIAYVTFFDNLILAWTVIKISNLSNKCNPENIIDFKLNELKIGHFRIFILKILKKLKKLVLPKISFKPVQDVYKDMRCVGLTVSSQNGIDYFSCSDKDELTSLITELEKCKSSEKPNPKTVPVIPASDKGDSDQIPPGGQKVPEGTRGSKGSA
ncbi:CYIR protein, partial [Plasmodium cynomolgi strain B]